jgi:hypothetical protein
VILELENVIILSFLFFQRVRVIVTIVVIILFSFFFQRGSGNRITSGNRIASGNRITSGNRIATRTIDMPTNRD